MKLYSIETMGWRKAILGMRFSFDSELQTDSVSIGKENPVLGEKDLDLMLRLIKGGASHRKFLRCIHIQAVANMSMTWWKQYDTYKVATVALSRSTMHTITKKLLTKDDFSPLVWTDELTYLMGGLNEYIEEYNRLQLMSDIVSKKKMREIFHTITDLIPMCYCQERMIDINYETALTIINQRRLHKLPEWEYFCSTLLKDTPYLQKFYDAMER